MLKTSLLSLILLLAVSNLPHVWSQEAECDPLKPECDCLNRNFLRCRNFDTFADLNRVPFDQVSELNFSTAYFFARSPSDLNNDTLSEIDIKLAPKANVHFRTASTIDVVNNPFANSKFNPNDVFGELHFENSVFDLTYSGLDCNYHLMDLGGLFADFTWIFFEANNTYPVEVCPWAFQARNTLGFIIVNISDDNYLKFSPVVTADLPLLRRTLRYFSVFDSQNLSLTSLLLDPNVYGGIEELAFTNTFLTGVDEPLFANNKFSRLERINLQLRNNAEFFREGNTEWIRHLSGSEERQLLLTIDNFPTQDDFMSDDDFCAFKDFPHEQNVFATLNGVSGPVNCTCTAMWLMKNWKNYKARPLNGSTVVHCLQPDSVFDELIDNCQFEQRLHVCDPSRSTTEITSTTTTTTTTRLITTTTPNASTRNSAFFGFNLFFILIICLVVLFI